MCSSLSLISPFIFFFFFFFWRQKVQATIFVLAHSRQYVTDPSYLHPADSWRLAGDSFLIVDLCSYSHMPWTLAPGTVSQVFPKGPLEVFLLQKHLGDPYTTPLGLVEGLERSRYGWYHKQLL